MILSLVLFALLAVSESEPQPYQLGAPATVEGAKLTVSRLLEATKAKDETGFDKIARGMAIMLAPDFGVPVSRSKFEESLKDCSDQRVVSAEPFPKVPEAQLVHVTMLCRDKDHPKPTPAVMDLMADNEHAFVVFPGGLSHVWPASNH